VVRRTLVLLERQHSLPLLRQRQQEETPLEARYPNNPSFISTYRKAVSPIDMAFPLLSIRSLKIHMDVTNRTKNTGTLGGNEILVTSVTTNWLPEKNPILIVRNVHWGR
jgi:hypothetical protein